MMSKKHPSRKVKESWYQIPESALSHKIIVFFSRNTTFQNFTKTQNY